MIELPHTSISVTTALFLLVQPLWFVAWSWPTLRWWWWWWLWYDDYYVFVLMYKGSPNKLVICCRCTVTFGSLSVLLHCNWGTTACNSCYMNYAILVMW